MKEHKHVFTEIRHYFKRAKNETVVTKIEWCALCGQVRVVNCFKDGTTEIISEYVPTYAGLE